MLVALLCSALAASPLPNEEAVLSLAVTPGAQAEALPPAQPGVLEIAVTGNRVSLHRQLQEVRRSGNLYLPGVHDYEAPRPVSGEGAPSFGSA
jgi:hypothetical protein